MTEQTSQPEAAVGFTLEVVIGATVEVVWRAMREPDQIRRWHGWHAESLDAEVRQIYVDSATESGSASSGYVLDVEGGDRFELHQRDDGTVVRLTRPSRDQVEGEWADWYDDITEGWTSFVHQLRFALERHPDEERRTLFLSGTGDPAGPLRDALAQHEEFFSTDNQRGLVLDNLGPGLVVLGETPARPGQRPGAMVIVSTYGLDDDAFAREQDAWTAWWRASFPDADPAVT